MCFSNVCFYKQKTAYGSRSSVWSSDVCSSDLVNDNLGHSVGDLMLQVIADRLKQCLRESDTVARIGGDEFVVLLRHIQGPAQTELIVEKIRSALSRPFTLGGQDRKSTRLNSSHYCAYRMPYSA